MMSFSSSGRPSITFVVFLLLSVVGIAVYYPGMNIPYYADDFQFVFSPPLPGPLHYFAHPLAENGFYRPLQAAYLIAVQRLFGLNTVPVHVLQLLFHVILSLLVFKAVKKAGASLVQALLASLFMLLSQADVHAVLSNDTLSQVGGTLFGSLALWSVAKSLFSRESGGAGRGRVPYRAAFYLAVALFFKETSLSFVVMILALVALRANAGALKWLGIGDGSEKAKETNNRSVRRGVIVTVVSVLLVSIGYLVVRSLVVPTRPAFGAGNYDFHIGANVIRNIAMFAAASVLPFSTVKVFGALRDAGVGEIAGIFGSTFVLILAVFYGLRSSGKGRLGALASCFAAVSLFPVVLMNHVSELYVYNAMPFVSVVFGMGLGGAVTGLSRRRAGSIVATTIVILALLGNASAVRSKAVMMREAGTRAVDLVEEIVPFVREVPEGGRLILLNPPAAGTRYSIFLVGGFDCLRDGLGVLRRLSGREDLTVEIWNRSALRESAIRDKDLVLTIEDGKVVRRPRD